MHYADDLQLVAVRSLERWDDCHTLPNFRQSKQSVRRATLEQNIRLDVREVTSSVEQPPDRITSVQQQQWIRGKAGDIDDTCMAEIERCGTGGQGRGWW